MRSVARPADKRRESPPRRGAADRCCRVRFMVATASALPCDLPTGSGHPGRPTIQLYLADSAPLTMRRGPDQWVDTRGNPPLSRLRLPWRCVSAVSAIVPKPGNNSLGLVQVEPERVRAGRGQPPVRAGSFLDRGQPVLPPAQIGQPNLQIVQRHGEAAGRVRGSSSTPPS